MAAYLTSSSKVIAIGATGAYGRAQIAFMVRSGTPVLANVSVGRGGDEIDGVPVFDTVADAVAATGADTAIIYTPALGLKSSIVECADAGIQLAVAAAEHVPLQDAVYALAYARERGLWVSGPNTVGMLTPGQAILGAISPEFGLPGRVAIVGRSGTLTLTVTRMLTRTGIGQSAIVHVGGDMVCGRNPHEWVQAFVADPRTSAVVYLGEIGGLKEYAMADVISASAKPVVALVVGRNAPEGKRMGHAGAIVGGDRERAQAKLDALKEAGAQVATSPAKIVRLLEVMQG